MLKNGSAEMMYRAGLVAVIVANGKIVREMNSGGTSTVYLPFGCEYSIRLKNNESRRAAVTISVDGKDVLFGHQLVVDANSESEVKGFLEDGGKVAKNAFKFIEKTEKIREHRGDKIDDGIVRIEFQFEEPLPVYEPRPKIIWRDRYPIEKTLPKYEPFWYSTGENDSGSVLRSASFKCSVNQQNTDGITVAGSHVNQKFGTAYLRTLESTKHVIVFELKGEKSDGTAVVAPLLSRAKVECPTCGTS
jgi:hypothetical protein